MIYKKSNVKSAAAEGEKYVFLILFFTYIIGVCAGCYFVFSNSKNVAVIDFMLCKSHVAILLYFTVALVLKYSGILSSLMCVLPMILGLQNAVYYCNSILHKEQNIFFSLLMVTLKDTSISLLLILYITLIALQIISKKYNVKKDFKYFAVYTIGTAAILSIDFAVAYFIA